ncbi:hypothetical protein FKM82_018545 [Ascaphus truei]
MEERLPPLVVYNNGGIHVKFSFLRPPSSPALLIITSCATNSSTGDITDFQLQAAAPKSVQIQLQAPSGSSLAALGGGSVTQTIRVLNPQKTNTRLQKTGRQRKEIRVTTVLVGGLEPALTPIDGNDELTPSLTPELVPAPR